MTHFCKLGWLRKYEHDWSAWLRSAAWSVAILVAVVVLVVLVIWARGSSA